MGVLLYSTHNVRLSQQSVGGTLKDKGASLLAVAAAQSAVETGRNLWCSVRAVCPEPSIPQEPHSLSPVWWALSPWSLHAWGCLPAAMPLLPLSAPPPVDTFLCLEGLLPVCLPSSFGAGNPVNFLATQWAAIMASLQSSLYKYSIIVYSLY